MEANVRKIIVNVDRVWRDRGPRLEAPIVRGWAAAVLENPFAGRYEEDLVPFMETLEPLAYELGIDLMKAMETTRPGTAKATFAWRARTPAPCRAPPRLRLRK